MHETRGKGRKQERYTKKEGELVRNGKGSSDGRTE
jgi:hypothetical protein